VDPESVLPGEQAPSKAEVLRAKLANIRQDLKQLQAELKEGFSKALATVLREQEIEEEKIAGELQDELAKSVRPAEKAWQELPSLVNLVRKEGDPARLRLRPILRSIIQEARLLLVRRASRLIACAQFFFSGGAVRHYFVAYQSAGYNRPRRWWYPPSLRDEIADPAELDLRRRDHAAQLESWLSAEDLQTLIDGMKDMAAEDS
jgi:hypothetical protein